ncbi:hypothetical protein D9V84_05855 [Bacteroidetes/Chlorobi group bacterium Naka2016]|nr:MAG: hypothetical protein D9V84_05855 [Bacteroidetes/Chlorobi group bacterium Naka2016]
MKNNFLQKNETFSIALIAIAVLSRFLPHPPNFTPVSAIALLSGFSFSNKFKSFFVPLIAMFLSDIFLGLHSTIWAVYLSLTIFVLFGFILKNKFSFPRLFVFSSIASLIFYLVTNFAVWLTSGLYPQTLAGLIQCYTLGLPFYRTTTLELFGYSFLGDLTYSFILFGAYKFAEKRFFSTAI